MSNHLIWHKAASYVPTVQKQAQPAQKAYQPIRIISSEQLNKNQRFDKALLKQEQVAIKQGLPSLRDINRLAPKITPSLPNLSAICIESQSFYGGSKQLAKDILDYELEKIQEQYEKEQENIELANLIKDIAGWAISGTAAVVSIFATPAAGAVVSAIGGIALGAADIVIGEISAAIERGQVDPEILDTIALVAKDDYWFGVYEEKYYTKSARQLKSLIFELYDSYEKIWLIPEQLGQRLAGSAIPPYARMTSEEIEERFTTGIAGKKWIASKNRIEIMLSVACSLYAEKAAPSASPSSKTTSSVKDDVQLPQSASETTPAENEEQDIFDSEVGTQGSDGGGKKALALIGIVAATAAAYLL